MCSNVFKHCSYISVVWFKREVEIFPSVSTRSSENTLRKINKFLATLFWFWDIYMAQSAIIFLRQVARVNCKALKRLEVIIGQVRQKLFRLDTKRYLILAWFYLCQAFFNCCEKGSNHLLQVQKYYITILPTLFGTLDFCIILCNIFALFRSQYENYEHWKLVSEIWLVTASRTFSSCLCHARWAARLQNLFLLGKFSYFYNFNKKQKQKKKKKTTNKQTNKKTSKKKECYFVCIYCK